MSTNTVTPAPVLSATTITDGMIAPPTPTIDPTTNIMPSRDNVISTASIQSDATYEFFPNVSSGGVEETKSNADGTTSPILSLLDPPPFLRQANAVSTTSISSGGLVDPPLTTTVVFPPDDLNLFLKHFRNRDITLFMTQFVGYSFDHAHRIIKMMHIHSMEDIYQIVSDGYDTWFDMLGPNSLSSSVAARFHRISAFVRYVQTHLVGQVDLLGSSVEAIRGRTYQCITPLINRTILQRLIMQEQIHLHRFLAKTKAEREYETTLQSLKTQELATATQSALKVQEHESLLQSLRQQQLQHMQQLPFPVANPSIGSHPSMHPPPHRTPPYVVPPLVDAMLQPKPTPVSLPDDISIPLSQQLPSQRRFNSELNDSERRRMEHHYGETRGFYRGMTADTTYIAPLIKRDIFDKKYTWNGLPETWDSFVQLFEGHWIQQSMDYFLHQSFRDDYSPGTNSYSSITHLLDVDPRTQRATISETQFLHDSKVVYGSLKTALRTAPGFTHFLLENNHDGFHAWFKLISMSQEGTNVHAVADNCRMLLAEPYHPAQHKSKVQFVTYKVGLYAKMDDLRVRHPRSHISALSDQDKMLQILSTLGDDDFFQIMDDIVDHGGTFDNFVQRLRRRLTFVHHRALETGRRRAHHTQVDPVPPAGTLPLSSPPANTTSFALAVQRANDPFYITPEALAIIKTFDPGFLQRYVTAKAQHRATSAPDERRDTGIHNPGTGTGNTSLPRQYTTPQRAANLVEGVPSDTNKDSSAHEVDVYTNDMEAMLGHDTAYYLDQLNNTFDTRNINTSTTIMANVGYCGANLVRTDGHYLCVSDSGADSWVLGKGWHVLDYHHKTVDLIGFDKKHAKKQNLPVVNAAAVFRTHDNQLVLGIVFHAVLNASCVTTLASENQTRNMTGNVVDSVSKKHKHWNGKYGKQAIRLAYSTTSDDIPNVSLPPITIDLRMDNALMTFQHRIPTDYELDQLPRYFFTSPIAWEPQVVNDDSIYIDPLTSNDALLYHTRVIQATMINAEATYKNLRQDHHMPAEDDDHSLSVLTCTSLRDKLAPTVLDDHVPPDPDGWIHSSMIHPCDYVLLPPHLPVHHPYSGGPYDPSAANDTYNYIGTCCHLVVDFACIQDGFSDQLQLFDLASHDERYGFAIRTMTKLQDAEKIQPYLGYRPLEVIRQTLENTTQLASVPKWENMRRHRVSLYPFMNRTHLSETVATDTFFSSLPAIGGNTCAQVFYGLVSHYINVYPMHTESHAIDTLQDFMRYEGIPLIIRSDNSKTQRYNKAWVELLRTYLVPAEFSEPHNQQQNPVELRAIKWLKQNIKIIQRKSGAPLKLWSYIAKYLADIHNITADETLGWKTPHFLRKGIMPDISPYLQFTFYEEVYYLDTDEKFPHSKELRGWWVGVAHHVGDHMCFEILTEKERVIERSVVRSAILHPNKLLTNTQLSPSLDMNMPVVHETDAHTHTRSVFETSPNTPLTSTPPQPSSLSTLVTDLKHHFDASSVCTIDSAHTESCLHEFSTSLVPYIDDHDLHNKNALITEGFKEPLLHPPLRQTRSGRNIKKPGRFIINTVTQSSPQDLLHWYTAIRQSCPDTVRLFPIVAHIPNEGPTDIIHHIKARMVINNEPVTRYIQLLKDDTSDPETTFMMNGEDINYDRLSYVQSCDNEVSNDPIR